MFKNNKIVVITTIFVLTLISTLAMAANQQDVNIEFSQAMVPTLDGWYLFVDGESVLTINYDGTEKTVYTISDAFIVEGELGTEKTLEFMMKSFSTSGMLSEPSNTVSHTFVFDMPAPFVISVSVVVAP